MNKLKTDTHLLQTTVTGSSGLFISNEDNMTLMARYPDNYFDLAIVDPEYGIDVNKMGLGKGKKKQVHTKKDWDSKIPSSEYFNELKRVSKNQIIWGGNYFLDYLNNTRCILTWDKIQDFSGSDFEMAWTSFDRVSKTFRMSRIEAYGKGTIHPTQKPVQLYKWVLKNYAQEGDKIIDTHLGSGSIAIAVEEMNRFEKMNLTLTACEIDKEYYTDTTTRINNHVAQKSLF